MRLSGPKLNRTLFAILLVGLALLLFVRHRSVEDQEVLRWYDRLVLLVTEPLSRSVLASREWVRTVTGRYIFLVRVEKENETLRGQMESLRARETLKLKLEEENKRLQGLLDLRSTLPGEWIAARVIAYPPIGPYRILTIDKGKREGMERRTAVVSSGGLVGQVARVHETTSQILLMTDPTSAVDARIEGIEARGLVVGKGLKLQMDREVFIAAFEYLERSVEIAPGQTVFTSGLDGVFPPDIPVGHVQTTAKKQYGIFQDVEIVPAVNFHALREVLVQRKEP